GVKLDRPDNQEAFSARDLSVRGNFIGLLKKENIISDVTLDAPYLFLEVDKKGGMVFPLSSPEAVPAKQAKKQKSPEKNAKPFLIKKFKIKNGSLDYLDRKVSAVPALIKMREVQADLKNFSVPPDNRISNYELDAIIPGSTQKGTLSSMGAINLKTKDTKSKLRIRGLDITQLRPYYEKKGDVEVTKGLLSMDTDIIIRNRKIKSSGVITITGLEFKTASGSFLGMPLLGVTKLLKDRNNQITLDFTLEGDLDNPKFSITDSLVQKIALSLAKSLGMPIEAIGKSVFDVGGSALKKLFK
ncbi:MAG TPA: DUF748 domain-containing protein, partial [Thermodesulfovibrionales bacterium]|nr:DUF748 domain-containing protein [Thermodesulfovibrionales bacterium]